MALLAKKSIRTLGLLATTLFLICAIVSIVLAGIVYRFAGPDWKGGYPWYALPGLLIACIIYTFFVAILAYLVFKRPNITFTIIFSVLLLISLLFNLAVAVFSLVAGSVGWVNTYFGCNGKFDGVLGIWQGIDGYLQQVDMALCSPVCPCLFVNTTGFVNNETVAPYYNNWSKAAVAPGNVAFQNCSAQVQNAVYTNAARSDALFDPDKTFNAPAFMDYMGRVENEFRCSGWCNVTYYNPSLQTTVPMFKYLFTDVNRGPPVFMGCLNSLINWLPAYLKAFGSVTMVLVGLQILALAMAFCQCWAREKDHEQQIPHHHDDNRR